MIISTFSRIKQFTRRKKQLLMIIADIFLLPFAFWIALTLRLGKLWYFSDWLEHWLILILIPLISIPLFIHYGLYRAVLKYMGYQVIVATVKAITFSGITLGLVLLFGKYNLLPGTTIFIYWFVSILLIVASRYIMKLILYSTENNKVAIALYGAGEVAFKVIDNLRSSSEYLPVAIFDDDALKWGTVINSIWVYSPNDMRNIIKKKKIKLILFSIIGISQLNKRKILQNISRYPVKVRMIVSIDDLISGEFNLRQVHHVEVADILGREPVLPNVNLLEKNIKNKHVLVTGAGGSIGKELCKQIVYLKPKVLVLYENNEYALYKTNLELKNINPVTVIIPVLCSVMDSIKFKSILQQYNINTIYHAAAYKHVSMVEKNPLQGIQNNIIGTYNCVKAALDVGISTFIFISTDKAVRPSNIMGATKRFSELILLAAHKISNKTNFSMVRFGNVLDSAGSVVPLFRQQIKQGGPVTVTHPEVTRYFMSIPEAVELVIQSGAMANGGDVFVLEMGDPIRIIDLAEKMIHLSGYELRSHENLDGEIEIKITGLRPGEKLNEELIKGSNVFSTDHPQILKAEEKSIDWNEIQDKIFGLISACESLNLEKGLQILKSCVEDWEPSSKKFGMIDEEFNLKTDSSSKIAEC